MGNSESSDSGGGNNSSSSSVDNIVSIARDTNFSAAVDRSVNTITLDNGGSINCRTGEISSYSLNDAIGYSPSNSGLDRNDEDRTTYSSGSSYDKQFVNDCYRSEREAYDKLLHTIDLGNGNSYNFRTGDFSFYSLKDAIHCNSVINIDDGNNLTIIGNCKEFIVNGEHILNIVKTSEKIHLLPNNNTFYNFKTGEFLVLECDKKTHIRGKLTYYGDYIYNSKTKIDIPITKDHTCSTRYLFRYNINNDDPSFITETHKQFNSLITFVYHNTSNHGIRHALTQAICFDAYDKCEKTKIKYFEDLKPKPTPVTNRPPVAPVTITPTSPQPNSIPTRVGNGHVMSAQARVNAVNQVASVVSSGASAIGNAYIQGANNTGNYNRIEAQATQQLVSNVASAVGNGATAVGNGFVNPSANSEQTNQVLNMVSNAPSAVDLCLSNPRGIGINIATGMLAEVNNSYNERSTTRNMVNGTIGAVGLVAGCVGAPVTATTIAVAMLGAEILELANNLENNYTRQITQTATNENQRNLILQQHERGKLGCM